MLKSLCHGRPSGLFGLGGFPTLNRVIHLFGFAVNLAYGTDLVITLFQVDKTYALCGTAHYTEVTDTDTQGYAGLVDYDKVIVISNSLDGNKFACLVRDIQGLDTLAAAVGLTVVLNFRTLAVALL